MSEINYNFRYEIILTKKTRIEVTVKQNPDECVTFHIIPG